MKDSVSVIGAGTVGLIAAKRLAELGMPVSVYDQKKALGIPARASGILSINGLRELDIDYRRAVTNTLNGAKIHAGKEAMRIRSQSPVAHVLDRKMLNDLCHDEAAAKGADVALESRMSGQKLDELAESNIVIGADGAVSEVAKHFSMGEVEKYSLTYKAEFNIESAEQEMVDLFFDNRITKGLFGWLCPNEKDVLEVGIGVDSRYGNSKKAFERFIQVPYVSEIIGKSKPISEGASIIPMSLRKRIVDDKRGVMLVGDAAGEVKPSTGGGIIFGGNAAIMASEVIKEHLDTGRSLLEYEKRYKRKYGLDTRLHAFVNSFYSNFSERGFEAAIKAFNLFRIDSFLGKYGDMDMPSMILRNILARSHVQ